MTRAKPGRMSEAIKLEILARFNAGASVADIVEEFDVSETTARRLRQQMKTNIIPLPRPKTGPVAVDEDTEDIVLLNNRVLANRIREMTNAVGNTADLERLARANQTIATTERKVADARPDLAQDIALDPKHEAAVLKAEKKQGDILAAFLDRFKRKAAK